MSREFVQVVRRAQVLSDLRGARFDLSLAERGEAYSAVNLAISEQVGDVPQFSVRYAELWDRLRPEVQARADAALRLTKTGTRGRGARRAAAIRLAS
ncbi:hypothetical protein [Cellulomonas soli]|uniref:hypothetical protein n=1 Tax=Cellulomonas soli TaxID=931535 RepID=UPI0011BE2EED|nr:hypothetical protein [Cellulomonas soli]NYI60318.1 hypothetical protein [Cellulomonas soli]